VYVEVVEIRGVEKTEDWSVMGMGASLELEFAEDMVASVRAMEVLRVEEGLLVRVETWVGVV